MVARKMHRRLLDYLYVNCARFAANAILFIDKDWSESIRIYYLEFTLTETVNILINMVLLKTREINDASRHFYWLMFSIYKELAYYKIHFQNI